MQKTRHLCVNFLHKCLVLVEATGLESDWKSVKSLINKGVLLILRQHFVNFLYTNALLILNLIIKQHPDWFVPIKGVVGMGKFICCML